MEYKGQAGLKEFSDEAVLPMNIEQMTLLGMMIKFFRIAGLQFKLFNRTKV